MEVTALVWMALPSYSQPNMVWPWAASALWVGKESSVSGVGAGALCRELEPSLAHLLNGSLLCELFTQCHLGIIFLNPWLGPLVMITAAAAHLSSTWHSHPSLLPHLCLVSLSWSLWPSSNKALNQVFQGTITWPPPCGGSGSRRRRHLDTSALGHLGLPWRGKALGLWAEELAKPLGAPPDLLTMICSPDICLCVKNEINH